MNAIILAWGRCRLKGLAVHGKAAFLDSVEPGYGSSSEQSI